LFEVIVASCNNSAEGAAARTILRLDAHQLLDDLGHRPARARGAGDEVVELVREAMKANLAESIV
jgi:hypothetical protein